MGELVARKSSLLVSRAAAAWKYLHGTINIYKPAEMETTQVITAIKLNLCRDLNMMELDKPKPLLQIENNENKGYSVQLVPNYGQDIFATGPRYTVDQIKIMAANLLGFHTSGVLLLGINKGIRFANNLRNGAPIQTYRVTGKFGKATETNFSGSRITMRATHKHVTAGKLQSLLSSMQATYQKQMYEMSGVDMQSQEGYELACKGLIRPKDTKHTVIYGIRNTDFTGKTFEIEVQAMNANEDMLANLIVDIAIKLRTVAHCIKLRSTRYGYYSFEDSLLRSHWNLQNVLHNMHTTQLTWAEHPDMISNVVSSPVGYEGNLIKK